jgi:hypothetical protein
MALMIRMTDNPVEGKTAHSSRQAGNEEVQIRRLDDAVQGIGEPWLHRRDQEYLTSSPT